MNNIYHCIFKNNKSSSFLYSLFAVVDRDTRKILIQTRNCYGNDGNYSEVTREIIEKYPTKNRIIIADSIDDVLTNWDKDAELIQLIKSNPDRMWQLTEYINQL